MRTEKEIEDRLKSRENYLVSEVDDEWAEIYFFIVEELKWILNKSQ